MIYNIIDYGAKSDGMLCTANIQKAIDECFINGGGEIVVPEGIYFTGCLRLRSNITLHLLENAILKGSTCPDDYLDYINDKIEPISLEERNGFVSTVVPNSNAEKSNSAKPFSRWNNAIIRAINAQNIAIVGEKGSEIDGQNCFDEIGEEGYRGPHAINMWFCENIVLKGYTIRDSANWAHAIQNSKHIKVDNITVLGGHDGFDVRTCDDIIIENSKFLTGDDCIAGFDNIGVTIRNCYFESSCSIFRFGATNMLVENCKSLAPATYGHRWGLSEEEKRSCTDTNENCRHNCLNIFLYYGDNRALIRKTPGNILIRNSHFKNSDAILRIPYGHTWCCNRSISDITFENCKIEGICEPIEVTPPKEDALSLYMNDCEVTTREKFEDIIFLKGKHIKKVHLKNVTLKGFIEPKILCDEKTDIDIA